MALIAWAESRAQPLSIQYAFVPASDVQTGGPSYDFRIGRFEVSNVQFAAFLNDAIENLDNERGHYMYFDVDSGSVYIHSGSTGAAGTTGSGTFLFDASKNPHMYYNAITSSYEVDLGYEDHPVVGVSWFGAVKFCNWITVASELGVDQRVYTEAGASSLDGWHPVTITTTAWASRDLSFDERSSLLELLGFRLPMDAGSDTTAAHNEWVKAAAARRVNGSVVFDSLYGFGRSSIGSADANFFGSGDPFEPGTTPSGFYDGTNQGGFQTVDSDNAYGIFDLSGNVWEWMQDQSTADRVQRRNRGGSWQSAAADLRVSLGVGRTATTADGSAGFRIVQRVVHDLVVTPAEGLAASGTWGGPYDEPGSESKTYRIENVTAGTVSLTVTVDKPWVALGTETIDIASGASSEVTVTIDPDCTDRLPPGTSLATVRFWDSGSVIVAERSVEVAVVEPLTVDSPDDLLSVMPFGRTPSPPNRHYIIRNTSDQTLTWATSQQFDTALPWVTLSPGGLLVSGGTAAPNVSIDVSIAQGFAVGSYLTTVDIADDCTGSSFERSVILDVVAPFGVSPQGGAHTSGVFGGPFSPTEHLFTVSNLIDDPVCWAVSICVEAPGSADCTAPADTPWLVLDVTEGSVWSAESEIVTATFTAAIYGMAPGDYALTLRFTEPDTGFTVDRVVSLEVTGLRVDPETDAEFSGPSGGPFAPESLVYEVSNTGLVEMSWSTTIEFDPPGADAWLDVAPRAGVIVDDTGVDAVTLSITADSELLTPGVYEARIEFFANGAVARRNVRLLAGEESFFVQMRIVPGDDNQPSGPVHDFRIGQFEITSVQYARFLNNARRNALSTIPGTPDKRSEYMYFDRSSGSVYINDSVAGEEGGTNPALTILLFDAGSTGQTISFEQDRYVVADGMEQIPVTGVTWYGAVKFCNWMTIVQGMDDPDERIYHEGPLSSDWYAVSDAEGLLALRGFRLPMDGNTVGASLYNEWFKAAAWLNSTGSTAAYGFGRGVLRNVDANFLNSGDPFDNQLAPVGFYDGSNLMADGTTTTAGTENGYGLYDITGNAAEWVHDTGSAADERGVRGGHFQRLSTSESLRNMSRVSELARVARSTVGFRVVQAVEPIELEVSRPADEPTRATGYVGGGLDREQFTLQITNTGTQAADDLSITSNVPWLEVYGTHPGHIAPGATVSVALRMVPTAPGLGVSPAPPGEYSLVPESDVQPGGPVHGFWIGQTTVTNSAFAGFLNGAYSDARSGFPTRSSNYMYFDQDSGSVYMNDDAPGEWGYAAPSATVSVPLYDGSVGRIRFAGDTFAVEPGYETHPVVGVSWYGAVKYCNWLGLEQGIPESLLAYVEGVDAGDWHPVVLSREEWLSGGPMSERARDYLTQDTLGYRLPMDDNAGGVSVYNEWYKAASRGGLDRLGFPAFGMIYGVGRSDALGAVDANYLDSGDTLQDGTTPVRFFDGINSLYQAASSCFPPPPDPDHTVDTDNGYGLYDISGNVAEWTQDFFGADASSFAVRGGSWRDPGDSERHKTASREERSPELPDDHTGFRVVRGTGHVGAMTVSGSNVAAARSLNYILDVREPLSVKPRSGVELDVVHGQTLSGAAPLRSYVVENRSATAMEWEVSVEVGGGEPWIDVTGPVIDEFGGEIAAAGTVSLEVAFNQTADDLPPGDHKATVAIRNVITNQVQTRDVSLSIGFPIAVEPAQAEAFLFSRMWHGPFDVPATRTFTLSNVADFDVGYGVSIDVSWLDVSASDPPFGVLSGTLGVGETTSLDVSIADASDLLGVGYYDGAVSFDFTDIEGAGVSASIEQPVLLVVNDPISFAGSAPDPWVPVVDPDALAKQAYVLFNNAETVIELEVSVDADWVDLDRGPMVDVQPGDESTVVAGLNENALELLDGTHVATVEFSNPLTGTIQCRSIEVTIVEDISLTPFADFETAGTAGGMFTPPFALYHVTNAASDGDGVLQWEAAVRPAEATWLNVNGGPASGGWLDDGESAVVVVSIDPAATAGLAAADHNAYVEFRSLPGGEPKIRNVSLTIAAPAFAMAESVVPGDVIQPGGPTYSFRMGTYPVTNGEFVAFLNDAMDHPNDERGNHMYFDAATGDVYVNSTVVGDRGAGAGGRSIKMFEPGSAGQIGFDGVVYRAVVAPIDYSDHPVAGVSWYGALKFANWLTIDQGMLPSERCYTEATDASPEAWHAVSISTEQWTARDLDEAERSELVTRYRCYRLPMDQGSNNGSNNGDVNYDTADTFNEWYKAAAWNPAMRTNTAYGFGRNQLTEADANFLDSTDPFDNGSTPVGYFDGSLKESTFQTAGNDNGFGIFDMTGNVQQWLQGKHNESPSLEFREIRGGSWSYGGTAPELGANGRSHTRPERTWPDAGVRVVRVSRPPGADFDGDGDIDADDYSAVAQCLSGPRVEAHPACTFADFQSDRHVDLKDFAEWQIRFSGAP